MNLIALKYFYIENKLFHEKISVNFSVIRVDDVYYFFSWTCFRNKIYFENSQSIFCEKF